MNVVGNDGLAGLDIRYDGEIPKENTWVEIEGVIGKEQMKESYIPVVKLNSIKETERGKSFVTN